jgi:diguanylate cyclase (GGDEF)-like protein
MACLTRDLSRRTSPARPPNRRSSIDANGNDVLAFRRGQPTSVPSRSAFGPALAHMIAQLPKDARTFDARSGLVVGAFGLVIVGVAPVVPASTDVAVRENEPRFLAVARAFDGARVASLGEDYVIDRLALGPVRPSSAYSEPLKDFDGNVVASLTWSPRGLGTQALASANPVALTMLAFLALTVGALVYVVVRSLLRLRSNEIEALFAASHDQLTGLPNRAALVARLDAALATLGDGGPPLALVYLDLDGFKEVNDAFGHATGDRLLIAVADRFRRICEGRLLVRLGGDECAVVIEGWSAGRVAVRIGQRLVDGFEDGIEIDGRLVSLSTSVGVVEVESGKVSVDELLRRADVAMYRAKHLGRDRICVFDHALDTIRIRRALVSTDLARALAADTLALVYQPIADAHDNRIVSAEALLRWPLRQGDGVSTADFVAIAEETGLIDELGAWTLRRACRAALSWPDIRVAVNVSPVQLRHADFAATVSGILRETGMPASRLEIEVTENFVISHPDQAAIAINSLRSLGVIVALDDFGTGFSSIGRLRGFNFDKIKIDRSLVTKIDSDRQAQELVQATVHIGRALGLTVTAEGVETEAEAMLLKAAGCDQLQGFFFGRPSSEAAMTALLGQRVLIEKAG